VINKHSNRTPSIVSMSFHITHPQLTHLINLSLITLTHPLDLVLELISILRPSFLFPVSRFHLITSSKISSPLRHFASSRSCQTQPHSRLLIYNTTQHNATNPLSFRQSRFKDPDPTHTARQPQSLRHNPEQKGSRLVILSYARRETKEPSQLEPVVLYSSDSFPLITRPSFQFSVFSFFHSRRFHNPVLTSTLPSLGSLSSTTCLDDNRRSLLSRQGIRSFSLRLLLSLKDRPFPKEPSTPKQNSQSAGSDHSTLSSLDLSSTTNQQHQTKPNETRNDVSIPTHHSHSLPLPPVSPTPSDSSWFTRITRYSLLPHRRP
jgi:hypothetical protein